MLSPGFLFGAALQAVILYYLGSGSVLYRMSVPVVCTLPYGSGWLDEYKSGYFKLALVRGSMGWYIAGKYLACTLAGGGAEAAAAWIYVNLAAKTAAWDYGLTFLTAALWAGISAVLAALSDSKYLAYGGAFVVCYFLVIVCEKYWPGLYCLYPYEWLEMQHTWPFGGMGAAAMLGGMAVLSGVWYYVILKGRIERG